MQGLANKVGLGALYGMGASLGSQAVGAVRTYKEGYSKSEEKQRGDMAKQFQQQQKHKQKAEKGLGNAGTIMAKLGGAAHLENAQAQYVQQQNAKADKAGVGAYGLARGEGFSGNE